MKFYLAILYVTVLALIALALVGSGHWIVGACFGAVIGMGVRVRA